MGTGGEHRGCGSESTGDSGDGDRTKLCWLQNRAQLLEMYLRRVLMGLRTPLTHITETALKEPEHQSKAQSGNRQKTSPSGSNTHPADADT